MFDINGDGSLSRDEVYNLLCTKQGDLANRISQVQTILTALDYDGKGHITFEGYVKAAKQHSGRQILLCPLVVNNHDYLYLDSATLLF
jgi:Ca2+-binding EF-hand superfamily protein